MIKIHLLFATKMGKQLQTMQVAVVASINDCSAPTPTGENVYDRLPKNNINHVNFLLVINYMTLHTMQSAHTAIYTLLAEHIVPKN